MRKSVQVRIPEPKKNMTKRDQMLKLISKKPQSAKQISQKLKVTSSYVAPFVTHLKVDGLIKSKLCPCCEVGRIYEVVKQ